MTILEQYCLSPEPPLELLLGDCLLRGGLDGCCVDDIIEILWFLRNVSDQTDHTRDREDQDGAVDVQRDPLVLGVRIDSIGDCTAGGFESSEETTGTRTRFDIGGEGAEDPVEVHLTPETADVDDQVREVCGRPSCTVSITFISKCISGI